ncbi:MAG: signal recognition particle protein, partial [Oscillospiraceae bacterium]|nr:signal recognition particle protein [Oscillospiraceae bacterium]
DAMTGQDAVNVAESFNKEIDLTGLILTKLDSDTRGGAALSLKTITNKPIKFIGVGEKMNDLEIFYPDRIASRILGMGDILSLIDKVQSEIDDKDALEMSQKLMTNEFNFENFLDGMKQIKKLGPISKLMEMIPGVNKAQLSGVDMEQGEKQLVVIESIISSMTTKERKNASLVTSSSSRKRRIAKGSGRTIQEVNRFLKDFEEMKKTMKQFKGMEKSFGKRKGMFGKFPF